MNIEAKDRTDLINSLLSKSDWDQGEDIAERIGEIHGAMEVLANAINDEIVDVNIKCLNVV